MPKACSPLAFLFLCASVTVVRGDLVWKTTKAETQADFEQKSATFSFPYRNTGNAPVRILSAEASCGCMSPALPPEPIRPGETGELKLSMDFDERTGTLAGTLKVRTDASVDIQTLAVSVTVPVSVSVHPVRLAWSKNEKPLPKSVMVTVADPERTKVERVDSGSPAFGVKLEPDTIPGTYRVVIQANDTSRTASTVIKIQARTQAKPEEFLIFAAVK